MMASPVSVRGFLQSLNPRCPKRQRTAAVNDSVSAQELLKLAHEKRFHLLKELDVVEEDIEEAGDHTPAAFLRNLHQHTNQRLERSQLWKEFNRLEKDITEVNTLIIELRDEIKREGLCPCDSLLFLNDKALEAIITFCDITSWSVLAETSMRCKDLAQSHWEENCRILLRKTTGAVI